MKRWIHRNILPVFLWWCFWCPIFVDAWTSPTRRSWFAPASALSLFHLSASTHRKRRALSVKMGMQVKIRIVGRKRSGAGDQWLEDAYGMYETRLRPSGLEVETMWHKNDNELIRNVQSDKSKQHSIVLLDPRGSMCTSEDFADKLYCWLDQGGSRLSFVIGGSEGLPEELMRSSIPTLGLSKLTFTHQFARTLLMEQIYRASEIRKGSGYHK